MAAFTFILGILTNVLCCCMKGMNSFWLRSIFTQLYLPPGYVIHLWNKGENTTRKHHQFLLFLRGKNQVTLFFSFKNLWVFQGWLQCTIWTLLRPTVQDRLSDDNGPEKSAIKIAFEESTENAFCQLHAANGSNIQKDISKLG